MTVLRYISPTLASRSACSSTKAICASGNLDLFVARSSSKIPFSCEFAIQNGPGRRQQTNPIEAAFGDTGMGYRRLEWVESRMAAICQIVPKADRSLSARERLYNGLKGELVGLA